MYMNERDSKQERGRGINSADVNTTVLTATCFQGAYSGPVFDHNKKQHNSMRSLGKPSAVGQEYVQQQRRRAGQDQEYIARLEYEARACQVFAELRPFILRHLCMFVRASKQREQAELNRATLHGKHVCASWCACSCSSNCKATQIY